MEKKLLTDKSVEAMKPQPERYRVGDTLAPGLLIQIGGRSRAWMWRGRLGGKARDITLGRYPAMGVAAARARAQEITLAQQANIDIIAVKEAAAAQSAALAGRTVDWMFETYMLSEGDAQRAGRGKRLRYKADIQPHIGSRAIYDITHADLSRILERKFADTAIGSNQVQKLLARMFRWAVTKGRAVTEMSTNPAADLIKLATDTKRERYLDDREIGYLLRGLEGWDCQIEPAMRLLLLTGARRSEIVQMSWDEVDLDTGEWLLPGARSKNGLELLLPLPPQAVAILKGIKRHPESKLVFYSHRNPEHSFSGFDRATNALRARVEAAAVAEGRDIAHWTVHDIRRSVASGMAGLRDKQHRPRVQPAVIESLLNHVSGVRAGVAGIYNRHSYFAEKRAALRLWAAHLEKLKPTPAPMDIV